MTRSAKFYNISIFRQHLICIYYILIQRNTRRKVHTITFLLTHVLMYKPGYFLNTIKNAITLFFFLSFFQYFSLLKGRQNDVEIKHVNLELNVNWKQIWTISNVVVTFTVMLKIHPILFVAVMEIHIHLNVFFNKEVVDSKCTFWSLIMLHVNVRY